MRWRRYLRLWGGRGAREVEDEISFHIEERAKLNREAGMEEAEARAEAVRRFGDVERIREELRALDNGTRRRGRWREWWIGWGQDVRLAVRLLRRSRLYATVVVLTLGVGIGANVAIFSFLEPYFLRSLPFRDPDRLVHLFTVDRESGWDKGRLSLPQYEDWRARLRGFQDLAAYYYGVVNLTGGSGPEQTEAGYLTANAFDVLGAPPLLGRTFRRGEDGPGGARVVVFSYGLWQRRYGGDPGVVGQSILMDGVPYTVVGVMRREFNFPFGGVKLWTPLRDDPATARRDGFGILVFGRLAPGWTMTRALADVRQVHAALAQEYPDADGRLGGVNALPMRAALNFIYDLLIMVGLALLGAVGFVLLIVCANIAGLALARASARRREVAIRSALGATRTRLVRQLLTESGVVALLGGGLGLALAYALVAALGPAFPEDVYRVGDFGVDGRVLAFAAGVSVLAALLSGLAPAFSVTGRTMGEALKEGGRSGSGLRARRFHRVLVAAEVALGLVLTAGAGLMARSLERVRQLPLGFEPDHVLTLELILPTTAFPSAEARQTFFDRLTEAAAALPGVVSAATVAHLPLNHETFGIGYALPGEVPDPLPGASQFRASPDYFRTMGIAVLSGRGFAASDRVDAPRVAVVNRTLARRLWPGRDPVGESLLLGDSLRTYRVVGVVDDVRHGESLTAPVPPQVYLSLAQAPIRRRFLVVRSAGPPLALVPALRRTVAQLDADLPTGAFRPMSTLVREAMGQWSIVSLSLGVFGLFAQLLAAMGIYGLIAYSVTRRRTEIGVRMALGARAGDVRRMLLADGLRLAGAGIVVGLLGVLALSRLVSSMLYGVAATDPVALGFATTVFLLVALLASMAPAYRAGRTAVSAVLRAE